MAMYKTLRELDTKTLLAVHNEATGKSTTRFASRGTGEDQTLRAIRKHCTQDAAIGEIWLNEAIDRFHGAPAAALKTKPEANEAGKEADKGASQAVTDLINIAHKTATVVEPVAPRGEEVPAEPKVKRTRKGSRPINKTHPAGTSVVPFREGSKYGLMVAAMEREGGASLSELYDICASKGKVWPMTIVRGAVVSNIYERGYCVTSEERDGVMYVSVHAS